MTAVADDLEQRLCACYERQLAHYDRAHALVAEQQSADEVSDAWLPALNEALDQIAALDAEAATDRERWRQGGRPAGPLLRSVLSRLAERIRTLHGRVEESMTQMQARRRQLLPELDGVVRQQQMLQAYRDCGPRPSS